MTNASPLTLNEFQNRSNRTAIYPGAKDRSNIVYAMVATADEAGEITNLLKKRILRDHSLYDRSTGVNNMPVGAMTMMTSAEACLTEDDRDELILEAGDVLWGLAQIATQLGIPLEEIAARNIAKLEDRHNISGLTETR